MRQGGWIRGSGDGNWGGNGDWNGDWNHLRCGVEGCGCVGVWECACVRGKSGAPRESGAWVHRETVFPCGSGARERGTGRDSPFAIPARKEK